MREAAIIAAAFVWYSTGKAGSRPAARGLVCVAEVEPRERSHACLLDGNRLKR